MSRDVADRIVSGKASEIPQLAQPETYTIPPFSTNALNLNLSIL